MTARIRQEIEARAMNYQRFDKIRLTEELISVCEDGLKVLRHVVYPSSYVRLNLLLGAGATRKHATSMRGSDPFIAKQNDPELDLSEYILSPLRTSLELGVFGSLHPWQNMRSSCIELVDLFGDSSISISIPPDIRLKLATMYLITSIKLSGQDLMVKDNILNLLASSPTMNGSVSKEISDILTACSSSSAPLPDDPSLAAAGAGGKGAKAPPKGAAVSAPSTGLSGRDALFLLANLQRECNPILKDGYEYDLCCDLHNLLKKDFESYRTKCLLAGVPDPAAQLTITVSSLSALYVPNKSSHRVY